MTVPACQLLFPHSFEHREMPVCQSLHCWLMWVTARNLQRSTSTVLIWGWKAEVIIWSQGQCHFTGTRWPGPDKSQCLQREEKGQRLVGGGTVWSGTLGYRRHPFIPCEKPADQTLLSPPSESTSHHPTWAPLCTNVWAEWTRCATTILEKPTQRVSENEKAPQSAKCMLPAWHQTGETPLGWVNRKLCMFLRNISRASLPDQG